MRKILFVTICVILLGTFGGCAQKNTKEIEFIKGADISSLEAVEDYGGVFYDFEGKEKDAIEILKENGVNYLRLRIWNDPILSFDAGDYCDLEHTVTMAKKIKKAGMNFLLDFHYSDWWADPSTQTIPAAWEGMSVEEMEQAIYDYTVEVLNTLKDENAYPDMIQIGNEIGNGMLWDYGDLNNIENLAKFLNSGIKAVRDTTPDKQNTIIMIHIQDGGSVEKSENFFRNIEANGVTDYDVIGLSYYPYWHGTFADLKENINNLNNNFDKKVIVAETAYAYTYENADGTDNLVSSEDTEQVGFEASIENQKLVTELVMNSVANSDGGFGVFYWEPTWISVKGVGAVKGGENAWENQAMFDFEGHALESLKAFLYEPGSMENDIALSVYKPEKKDINVGTTKEEANEILSNTVSILYSDGSVRDTDVSWDLSALPEELTEFTSYTVDGEVMDFTTQLNINITQENLLNNLSFEEGDTGWIVEKSTDAGIIRDDDDSNPKSGEWSFHYWDDKTFSINLYQKVQIEETESYTLDVWSQGVGGTDLVLELYAAYEDGTEIACTEFRNDGWAQWQHPRLTNLQLEADEVIIIGLRIEGKYDDWGTVDDFALYKGEPVEEKDFEEVETSEEKSLEEVNSENDMVTTVEGNLLINTSFEDGTTAWDIDKDTEAGIVRDDDEGNPKSGLWSFQYWDEKEFMIDLSQQVIIPEDGSYRLAAWSQGGGEKDSFMQLYIKDIEGNIIATTSFTNAGWAVWQNPITEPILLNTNDMVTVGIRIEGQPDDWGTFDDITFYPYE